jgi:DNA primase
MSFLGRFNNLQKQFESFIIICRDLLKESKFAEQTRNYLDSRVSDTIVQNKYEFGYFPDDDNLQLLLNDDLSEEDFKQMKLMYNIIVSGGNVLKGHFSEHNLVFPIRDLHGNIVSFMGRSILSSEELADKKYQKYKYLSNIISKKEQNVFGLNFAKDDIIKKNCVICVEGQFDCISMHAAGITNVVAVGGSNLSIYQFFQIYRYTKNIILMFDNDIAGNNAKNKICNKFKTFGVNIKSASGPKDWKDMDSFLHSGDEEYKRIVIENIRSLFLET